MLACTELPFECKRQTHKNASHSGKCNKGNKKNGMIVTWGLRTLKASALLQTAYLLSVLGV